MKSAADRLNLLVPWLNGRLDREVYRAGDRPEDVDIATDYDAARFAASAFLRSFDGSEGAGHLAVVANPRPAHISAPPKSLSDEQLDDLRARLQLVLTTGIDFPAGALRFSARHVGRQSRWRTTTRAGRLGREGGDKAYRAAGAYVLEVHGPPLDVVPFLMVYLLKEPNMVSVRQCQALGCTNILITAPDARGKPRKFCMDSRAHRTAGTTKPQRKKRRQT